MNDWIAQLNLVKAMLSKDFNWEQHWQAKGPALLDVWKKCHILVDLDTAFSDSGGDWFACGSSTLSDTPKALYRMLWLCNPKRVDFSDMYKSPLLAVATPDKRFLATFELFKFEAGLYFYAPQGTIQSKGLDLLVAGWPGADNGRTCQDSTGQLFFDVLKRLLEYRHGVYSGNNFEV